MIVLSLSVKSARKGYFPFDLVSFTVYYNYDSVTENAYQISMLWVGSQIQNVSRQKYWCSELTSYFHYCPPSSLVIRSVFNV